MPNPVLLNPLLYMRTPDCATPSATSAMYDPDDIMGSEPLTLENFRPSMPQLAAPQKPAEASVPPPNYNAVIQTLIATLEKIHDSALVIHQQQTTELTRLQQDVEKVQRQQIDKMRDNAEKIKQQGGFWNMLEKLSTYVKDGVYAVFGSYLVAQGAPIMGGLMLAAGLISVANTAFSDCETWDWVAKQLSNDKHTQAQLKTLFPGVVGLVSAAMGFGGLGQVWAMADQIDFAQNTLLVMQTALSLVSGVSSISSGVSQYDLQRSQGEQLAIELKLFKNEHALEQLTNNMQRMSKVLSECTSTAARMIKLSIYSNQKTMQI